MPNDGKAFEISVRELLRLSGYTVTLETLIAHKKVDALAQERRFNDQHRIAVECKEYSRPLTKEYVAQILAEYRPLYDQNHVDEVLLVTDQGISAAAETLVRGSRFLRHVTLAQLQSHIIDFASYLQFLREHVKEDGLDRYFVPPRLTNGSDLETFVADWLESSTRPLAILGSYGMGKTSFVRHMAAVLAERALSDVTARIPIVIHLSEISAEQSLAGLLGRVLAKSSLVRHYNFEIFSALNTAGRFVIFLDGFDEMKHTLTWEQFCFNFSELNRLVTGDSRVVLLGRPTAFLSDNEHDHALHGKQWLGDRAIQVPGWPDYQEVHLAPFTPEQVQVFLVEYTAWLSTILPSAAATAEDVLEQIEKISPGRLSDLATRPVQLRILAEVLPQWSGDPKELTPARLYGAFIDLVIEREQKKLPSRSRFTAAERRAFAGRLAYWLWTERTSVRSVSAIDIPSTLFPPPKSDDTADGVRRDMVSACFLDRKKGDALYFPHRSFQEFLVAEEIVARAKRRGISIKEAATIATPEVLDFLAEMIDGEACTGFDRALLTYRGTLPTRFINVWLGNQAYVQDLIRPQGTDAHPWRPILLALAVAAASSLDVKANAMSMVNEISRLDYPMERMLRVVCVVQMASLLDEAQGDEVVWSAMSQLRAVIMEEARMKYVTTAERQFLLRAKVMDTSYNLDASVAHTSSELRVFALTEELGYPTGPYPFRTSFRLPVPSNGRTTLQQVLLLKS